MSFNIYDEGDLIVLSAVFTDRNAAPINPTVVTFKIKDPSNVVTTYVFGTDAELIRDSTGIYHVDIPIVSAGDWHYRWQSTGLGQAAEEGKFQIKQGYF